MVEMDLDLCWLLGPSVLEKRYTTRKQPNTLMTNWPTLSACHAGFNPPRKTFLACLQAETDPSLK
jgi:hypothetical protein